MNKSEELLCVINVEGQLSEHKGVKDFEYPIDLNSVIIVLDNGNKYLVTLKKYIEET